MVPSRFGDESIQSREICSGDRYKIHFYCLAVEAGFYSDVIECLPLGPAAQVRIPPRAVGIFLHPMTYKWSYFLTSLFENTHIFVRYSAQKPKL